VKNNFNDEIKKVLKSHLLELEQNLEKVKTIEGII